jgi:hypothetical protein
VAGTRQPAILFLGQEAVAAESFAIPGAQRDSKSAEDLYRLCLCPVYANTAAAIVWCAEMTSVS